MFAVWNDYFNFDMKFSEGLPEPEFLKASECQEASDVTQACRYQSRGFTGQTSQWIERWINGQEPEDGKAHGAARAFLEADECNENAIHLYESTGFKCKKDEREINMIREK